MMLDAKIFWKPPNGRRVFIFRVDRSHEARSSHSAHLLLLNSSIPLRPGSPSLTVAPGSRLSRPLSGLGIH